MNRNDVTFGVSSGVNGEDERGVEVEIASGEMTAFSAAVSIVIASINSGHCPRERICDLLRDVHETGLAAKLREGEYVAGNAAPVVPASYSDKPVPAVPVEESIFDDYIICLEDGKKLQLLKRYLRRAYGMTPEQYRLRWGLPDDYPMIAPSLSEKRSSLVRDIKPYLARKRRIELEPA